MGSASASAKAAVRCVELGDVIHAFFDLFYSFNMSFL